MGCERFVHRKKPEVQPDIPADPIFPAAGVDCRFDKYAPEYGYGANETD